MASSFERLAAINWIASAVYDFYSGHLRLHMKGWVGDVGVLKACSTPHTGSNEQVLQLPESAMNSVSPAGYDGYP